MEELREEAGEESVKVVGHVERWTKWKGTVDEEWKGNG